MIYLQQKCNKSERSADRDQNRDSIDVATTCANENSTVLSLIVLLAHDFAKFAYYLFWFISFKFIITCTLNKSNVYERQPK